MNRGRTNYAVIRGASFSLIHAPAMLIHYGTTPSTERLLNPGSDFLKKLPQHLRSFEDAVAYLPNQVFIGNAPPEELRVLPRPWYLSPVARAPRTGKYGIILTEDELIGVMKIVDSFDLVRVEESFVISVLPKLRALGLFTEQETARVKGHRPEEILPLVEDQTAAPLYSGGRVVGCVRRAHASDPTLAGHVMAENTVSKASGLVAMKTLFATTGVRPEEIDYVIETSEEACGDMNQRGGGNFSKAIGEAAGCVNATGSDVRSFCAGPAHGLVMAASLVRSGVYKNVVVMAGGTTAKLGLNSRDHVNKGMPALEDMLGTFAIHVSEDDGKSPIIRTDSVGGTRLVRGLLLRQSCRP